MAEHKHTPLPLVSMEEAMQDWRQAVMIAQPLANSAYVRTVCEEVVRRAHILSELHRLNFPEVAAFLLMTSRDWVLGGDKVENVGKRMPKTLHDLGVLKATTLTQEQLKRAMAHPIIRTVQ